MTRPDPAAPRPPRRLLPLAAVAALLVAALGVAVRLPGPETWPERERLTLEDGWVAVIRVRPPGPIPLRALPGQSGDRPGRVALYAPDGRFCGDAPVEMVGAVEFDREGGEVSVMRPRTTVWDLIRCEVRFRDLYRD